MDKLVEGTLLNGLVPLVVMEFPGITVGGGFSGTSGESSSFRYGFFDRAVNRIEVVLPNGEKVTASRSEKSDLFRGAAAAFGTLGVVTLLEVQLMEAKKSVVYNIPTEFYIHAGRRTAHATEPIVDFIQLVDYIFRYDRGGFWVGKYAFKYFIIPFNRISRYFLDRFMHTRVMCHALHQSGHSRRYIIQDVAVPYQAADEFLQWLHDNFGFYPLWLCHCDSVANMLSLHTAYSLTRPTPTLPNIL
ncbi:hypothetical protein Egran_06892 [Elaphomyces granulatus]|uniref:Delta(24)-sterol reductase n=1 Tax=Elaphomyces granulatus TaxID=519963 RepID=A0A232LMF6_9EURO|nr:hypothetical protein Egran_06892 [Elaphomyces granulatus]